MNLKEELSRTSYPGRGIIAGLSPCGKYAISAYWTMGRSAGSRNRIFVVENENNSEVVKTKAFDPTLIAGDPSLIIYAAVRLLDNKLIDDFLLGDVQIEAIKKFLEKYKINGLNKYLIKG